MPSSAVRSRRKRLVRAKTVHPQRISKRELAIGRALYPPEEFAELQRPRTRDDCKDSDRPCPFVACKHHLYLDVEPNGSIRFRFPDIPSDELEKLPGTCELDLLDHGEMTIEAIAEVMNLTRERIRQIETAALAKLQAGVEARELRGIDDAASSR